MFSLEQALAQNSRVLAQRAVNRTNSYALYFSNETKSYAGKIVGTTRTKLKKEFFATKGNYRYAVITPLNNPEKYLAIYNRDAGKTFTEQFRKTVVRKKKVV